MGVALRQAGPLQCGTIQREAAAPDKHAEARCDECRQAWNTQLRPLLRPSDLAIGQRVTEVGKRLARERDQEPEPVRMQEPPPHRLEADGRRHTHRRAQRERTGNHDQDGKPVRLADPVREPTRTASLTAHRPTVSGGRLKPHGLLLGRRGAGAQADADALPDLAG